MSELLEASRPDFFGKDNFTPFIGQVEDVNDPTHSGRVKVRCVGWHPKNRKPTKGSDDSLPTESLPWARVGMPTTMAQQSRIGGKHGLLPGTWVMGFFMDGEEAQDPFVLTTFNFTSKVSKKDNRKDVAGNKGTLSEEAEGFDKLLVAPNTSKGNFATHTTKEQGEPGFSDPGDPAGDNVTEQSQDSKCGDKRESAADNEANNKEFTNPGTPAGQKFNEMVADGRCGGNQNTREDIQLKMSEKIIPMAERFTYGDVVWQRYQGNFVDMNGVLAQLALIICSLLKQLVESLKAEEEERINRKAMAATPNAVPDRDGVTREQMIEKERRKSDIFHALIAALIDKLCSLIMAQLQNQNNSGTNNDDNDNAGGDGGAGSDTTIENPNASCLADQLINNVLADVTQGIEEAHKAADELVKNSKNDDGSDLDEIMNAISMVIGFGTGMLFPLRDQYADKTQIHNSQGNKSQDKSTREGCKQSRFYNTADGAALAAGLMAAFGGGSGGGNNSKGNYDGRGSRDNISKAKEGYKHIGPGGMPSNIVTKSEGICEDAAEIIYPDVVYPGIGDEYPDLDTPVLPGINTKPSGESAETISISLPSSDTICARNFIDGTPNTIVIQEPGNYYYYNNEANPAKVFPSVYIPGYIGTPIPVVDKTTGEMVGILTECPSWDPNEPQVPVTILPDNSEIGYTTDDENIDVVVGGFFIQNTGFNYCFPEIKVYDRDGNTYDNAIAKAVLKEGRIVDVEIINNGTGFKRIPRVEIVDDPTACGGQGGYGAKIYPIMNVIAKPNAKTQATAIEAVYCPAKNQINSLSMTRDTSQMVTNIIQEATGQ